MDIYLVVKVSKDSKHGWWVIQRDPSPKSRDRFVIIEKFSNRAAAQEYADKLNADET